MMGFSTTMLNLSQFVPMETHMYSHVPLAAETVADISELGWGQERLGGRGDLLRLRPTTLTYDL